MTVLSDLNSPVPSVDVASSEPQGRSHGAGALVRKIRTSAPVVPFLLYVILVLGVPTGTIAVFAFRSNSGHFTWSNIHTILGSSPLTSQYRAGFENSLKLAVVTAVIPGVLGTIIAYAISTSEHPAFKRIVAATSGVLAQFGGVNLAFMFIAALAGTNGLVTKWLASIGLDPWNHGWSLYKFWGVALVYMYFQIPLMVLVITPAFAGLRPAWREAAENLGASQVAFLASRGYPRFDPRHTRQHVLAVR